MAKGILAALILTAVSAAPSAAGPFEDSAKKPGAVIIKNTLCKISVGRTLPDGTDAAFTFDCAAVITPSATGMNVVLATARVSGWTGGFYRSGGFACIVNRTPVGGGFACTTNSQTTVLPNGRAGLICLCKLSDPSCKPIEPGKEPCAP